MTAVVPRTIVHCASEMTPVVKVGGLGDVVGALAAEQARRGHRVTVVIPAYREADLGTLGPARSLGTAEIAWGMGHEPATFELHVPVPGSAGFQVLRIGHAGERAFFDRAGVYDDPATREGHPDNGERFLFFCRATMAGLARLGEPVEILHAHDHQAAWIPCLARTHHAAEPHLAGVATVFTVHNLGYQGIHDAWVLGLAGFGREHFDPAGPFEFWGRVNFMKVGLSFADLISTVSPRYAAEIQTTGEYGFGLEGVLARRGKDLRGILNGIDDVFWDPARDVHLRHHYDRDDLTGKAKNRAALLEACGFPPGSDWPVFGMVTRLVDQKGFDLIEQLESELLRLEARFVILGHGQARYQDLCGRLMAEAPHRVHYRTAFDEPFAHLIEAGSDLFLMPSRYEPCGLNQMYSMRYGTVPLVRATGGLADTVEDFNPATRQGTGFVFQRHQAADLLGALRRSMAVYRQPHVWRAVQANGMAGDFSWQRSADQYEALYDEARGRVLAGRTITLAAARAAR